MPGGVFSGSCPTGRVRGSHGTMPGETEGSLSALLGEYLDAVDRGETPQLHEFCGGNAELIEVFRKRLDMCRAIDHAIGVGEPEPEPTAQGELVGGWRLGRSIGEGGFGSVYEAHREDGRDDRAAVKVLHRGAMSAEARSRFRTEAQALALVRHPNVASILDSGVTETGTPYLVLELIEGLPIDRYCLEHCLSVRERIRLMHTVCRTVEYAHAKGVLHRDLKPSNVLVMDVGASPVPKIIDFGIARFIQGVGPDRTQVTAAGQVLGTARYMSPEQLGVIEGSPDTRSDIYSLGVLLYELATGSLPYEDQDDRITSVYQLQQRIRSSEPRGLTTRAIRDGSLNARELDWIAMRCIEVDPARRYATCRELADDIERLLTGEAILAGPRSRLYLTKKFVSRHRGAVGVVSAAGIGLVLAAAGTTWGLLTAQAETRRALAAEAESHRIIEFQYDMLRNLDPAVVGRAIAEETRARTAPDAPGGSQELEASAAWVIQSLSLTDVGTRVLGLSVFEPAIARIDRDFADAPPIRGRLLASIGMAQLETGLREEGLETYRRAFEMLLEQLGPEAEQTLITQRDYANALIQLNRPDEALANLEIVTQGLTKLKGKGDLDTVVAIIDQGSAYYHAQRLDEARERWAMAVELGRKHLGTDHELTNTARGNLGLVLTDLGEYEQAEPNLREQRSYWIDRIGLDHHQTIVVTDTLARCLALQKKFEESLELYRDALARADVLLGVSQQDTIRIRGTFIRVLTLAGHFEEALDESERHLASIRADLPDDSALVLMALYAHGKLLVALERFPEAEAVLGQATSDADRVFGPDSRYAALIRLAHAEAIAGLGRSETSLDLCESVYAILSRELGETHPESIQTAQLALRVLQQANEQLPNRDETRTRWQSRAEHAKP